MGDLHPITHPQYQSLVDTKQKLLREIALDSAAHQARHLFDEMLSKPFFPAQGQVALLERGRRPTQREVLAFGQRFLRHSFMEVFIMGNVDNAAARCYAAVLRRRLALTRAPIPRLQSLIVPVGRRIYSRRNTNPVDHNSVSRLCSQVGPSSDVRLITLAELTDDIYHQ